MIQNLDTSTLLMPTRRRAPGAAPVLIQIPDLAASRAPGRRTRRRRLRREVRVAGSILLALLPASLLLACLGGDRPARLAASSLTAAVVDPESASAREVPAVSLSLEPVAPGAPDPEVPVFLPGILLPAESTEEDLDGRH